MRWFAAALCLAGLPAFAQVTAYEGATLITGDGRVIERATVVVDGDRIAQAAPSLDVRVPAGAKRVSAAGKTIMPMLIDTHVHLGASREALLRDLRARAQWGVSAAMSLGTDGYENLHLRNESIPGAARFLSAGRGITMQEPGRTTVPYWVASEAEARKAVGELAANKVDIVKIWVDTRDGKFKKLSPELYGAVIDEAHKRGLRVTAHLFDLEDAKGLIRAGVDALAHGVRDRDVDDEIVAMLRQRPGLFLTPNLPERGVKTDLSWLRGGIPEKELATMEQHNVDRAITQQFYGIQARNLARLNAAGVRITMGTDGNRPWGAHEEMLDMVMAGMTPMEVIVASTRNSAEFLRLADTGTLVPGKSADFIVLDANPLDNIANTRRISSVILRGAAVQRTAQAAAADSIVLDGSTGMLPLASALAAAYRQRFPEARVEVGKGLGTGARLRAVADGKIHIALASHGIKPEDVQKDGLSIVEVAKGAIVFAVNAGVPVANMTESQVCDAYSGRITSWQPFGGSASPVALLSRPPSEVDPEVIRAKVACFTALKESPAAKVMARGPDMAKALAETPDALGMTSMTVVEQSAGKVKALTLNGTAPTAENVKNGRYFLTRDFLFVVKRDAAGPVKRFVDFVLSPEGDRVIQANGAVPLR